ncbi:hypothetical protein M440DRAFT_1362307 [Trichoderma longibrachiatum ATCC 18648]|uniref:DNA2/NAM7 helicase helicase domain-containing protein n=1 Tax=Trichoderma longibrachiatum ATCC 18648 TaxID=983965 RepID=A0A2T4BUY1_TRILO|nr:hypothetical protein M440DRAFT_1362307 [Trichoderma longibrachiatum ATCC 18648]
MSESVMSETPEVKKVPSYKKEAVDAAVFVGNDLGPIGLSLRVPLSKPQTSNERRGFGVCHRFDPSLRGGGSVAPADHAPIVVRLPREGCSWAFDEASVPVYDRFPNATGREKGLTVIQATLAQEARVTVLGFGMPFADADDPEVEGWISDNKPIASDATLLDFLGQRKFCMLVRLAPDVASKRFSLEKLPPPFAYPYGTNQRWDVGKYKDLIRINKGQQFWKVYSHDDDDHHMATVIQSNVQDAMWLDDMAIKIAESKFLAYFIRPDSKASRADTHCLYVVVAMPNGFISEHQKAWSCLSKKELLLLHLYDNPVNNEPDAIWKCKIVDRPAKKPGLALHNVESWELVLEAHPPKRAERSPDYVVKDFADRAEANDALKQGIEHWYHVSLCFDAGLMDCKRRVEAVSLFHPLAEPSNPFRWGLPDPTMPAKAQQALKDKEPANQAQVEAQLRDRMELHRAIVRGNGFYDCMVKTDAPRCIVEATSSLSLVGTDVLFRRLPCVNFLEFGDSVRAEAIVNEALPHDRDRFRAYLSNRPLGFGIIAGEPAAGKTTIGAAATAAMVERYGRVLCSAPTDAAVDDFAACLDARTRAVVEACNRVEGQGAAKHHRHRLVIRACHPSAEVDAFNALLRDPKLGNKAAPKGWEPRWKLHLSLAFWFLAVLGSPAVPELHPEDSQDLWDLRHQIDSTEPELERLRDVATGATTWEQYEKGGLVPNKTVEFYLLRLLPYVNMLCVTPAESEDAGKMNRADLYCVWGNTCLPCLIFGDTRQQCPTVLTPDDKDSDGNCLNRFARNGSISALVFLMATGLPVYRLFTRSL